MKSSCEIKWDIHFVLMKAFCQNKLAIRGALAKVLCGIKLDECCVVVQAICEANDR